MNLSQQNIELITGVFLKNLPSISFRLYVFGSRTKHRKQRKYSDIDLAINCNGQPIKSSTKARIEFDLEHSVLPYKVDLVDLNTISEEFKSCIMKDLVQLI